jgi:hypothetical protein
MNFFFGSGTRTQAADTLVLQMRESLFFWQESSNQREANLIER